jgi:hypothetical protein
VGTTKHEATILRVQLGDSTANESWGREMIVLSWRDFYSGIVQCADLSPAQRRTYNDWRRVRVASISTNHNMKVGPMTAQELGELASGPRAPAAAPSDGGTPRGSGMSDATATPRRDLYDTPAKRSVQGTPQGGPLPPPRPS